MTKEKTDKTAPQMPDIKASLLAWPTHSRVWRFAVPIILANLSTPLLGATDTAVLGHLPDPAYIGAIAVGALIFDFIYWGFGFLRMGTTGLVAQAAGSGDRQATRLWLLRGLLSAACLAVLLWLLAQPIVLTAVTLIQSSDMVEAEATRYFFTRILGAPAALGNFVILGALLGLQEVRRAFILQIAINGVNIVLDLVFVLQFGWATEGVATATIIAEYMGLAIGLVMLRKWLMAPLEHGSKTALWRAIANRAAIHRLIAVNGDIFIRTLLLILAFALVTALGARMGEITLAANQVLLKLIMFLSFGLDGFAHAAEALVGRAVGANDRKAMRIAVIVTGFWAIVLATLFAIAVGGLGDYWIVLLTTGTPAVRATAILYLPWVIIQPFAAVWCYQLDGIFIGATETRAMRNMMIISFLVFLGALAVAIPLWANHGLWFALTLFNLIRDITLGIEYPKLERNTGARR